jgi:hypothetical protein
MELVRVAGAGFRSITEAVDTTTSAGRMVMQMLGSFAEFERSMVRERTRAGLRLLVLEPPPALALLRTRKPAGDFQPARQPARRFGLGIHAQRHKRTDDFDNLGFIRICNRQLFESTDDFVVLHFGLSYRWRIHIQG